MNSPAVSPERQTDVPIAVALRALDRFRVAVWAIVALQALWLGILTSRGWYYESDFSNLAAATGRPLSWAYLSESQGGHLDPLGRTVFWLLNRTIPLNYAATIVLRVLGQAVATVLLARVLTLLNGRRRSSLLVLALYASTPFIVQSTLWLTAAVSFQLSQIFVLLAVLWHVRYDVTRQTRWAAAAAAALFVATLASEQAAVSALALPLISAGFLHDGSIRNRLRGIISCWREWLMIFVPIAIFVVFFLGSGSYTGKSHLSFSVPVALRTIGQSWLFSFGPGLIGGPFTWYSTPAHAFAVSDPSVVVEVLSGVVVVSLIALSVRRTGPRALVGWAIPALVSAVGMAVVSFGRFEILGGLIARQFEHAAYTAVPAAIGVCLAFTGPLPADIAVRVRGSDAAGKKEVAPAAPHRSSALRSRGVVFVVAVIVAASLVSGATYSVKWAQSPAERYVANLRTTVHTRVLSLFDSTAAVIPTIVPYHNVSDLLTLMGEHVSLDTGSRPKIVNSHGRAVRASFYRSAAVDITGTNSLCNYAVHNSERTDPLNRRPARNDWFLRIAYFQQQPSVVYVTMRVASGREIAPYGGARVVLGGTLEARYLRFPTAAPAAIRIRSGSLSSTVCITSLVIGFPYAARGSR